MQTCCVWLNFSHRNAPGKNMNDDQYQALVGKIDGVAKAFMLFITEQEERGNLDGTAYCRDLRLMAAARDSDPRLMVSAGVMKEIAGGLEQARMRRKDARADQGHQTELGSE